MLEKILFVDDDANILAAYKRNLRKEFNIATVTSGEEGLALLHKDGPFAVVLSDLRMPGLDGFDFLSKVKDLSPDSICIMLTGHAELQASLRAVNEGYIFRFLTKPCKVNILSKAINSGLEQYLRNVERRKAEGQGRRSTGSKKILIVDDDPEILSLLSHSVKAHKDFDVVTADTGIVAVKLLRQIKIDLLVLDREIPDIDGLELFDTITREFPDIPVMMMTWCLDENILEKVNRQAGYRCFEKPFHMDDFTETVVEELYSGPKGVIDGISIPAFLQMIEMEEKTCTLNIKSAQDSGTMYFLKGCLMDAETGNLTGQDAAFRIINWVKAAIEIENMCRRREKMIRPSLMQILMEAAKMKDDMYDTKK
ncbi:MAG: response regulator [Proteobacteria bacterium]|nr:response regulator [Pseudomonadota bacterium]